MARANLPVANGSRRQMSINRLPGGLLFALLSEYR